ncbi:MAG: alpha/beta hydrolase [Alphaproteobacteria bacterium]|nr:alpha/beta hydrolase [Alphaproteobacteria bacterium]
MTLAFTRVGDEAAPHTAWILHGILGAGRNWRSFARKLVARHPDWGFVLPDLRNHGATGPLPPPHRLIDCVADLDGLPDPELVLGHSFGGKVALAWARDRGTAREVWVLDSIPVSSHGEDDSEVMHVLECVSRVAMPAADRRDVRAELLGMGLSQMLVDWLLTSLEQGDEGWRWVYGLDGVRAMMADYFATDFGPFLAQHTGAPHVHLVRAANSDRWTPDVLARIQLGRGAELHVLPDAGHWLHVDNPDGLLALLDRAFRGPG